MATPIVVHGPVADFQRAHRDHLGLALVPDGVLGPRTQWAMAIDTLENHRKATVLEACSHVGLVESAPNEDRAGLIAHWLLRCGVTEPAAWCAAFASYCLGLRGGIASALALGAHYPATKDPIPGDVMWYPTGGGHGHCGIVIGSSATEVMTVEGNLGNKVQCVRRAKDRYWYGRSDFPDYGDRAGVLSIVDRVDNVLDWRTL
jgi:CHAP domain-containing protein